MPRPIVQQLPPAPQRGEDFQTFSEKANAHVAALTPWTDDVNELAAWVNDTASSMEQQYDFAIQDFNNYLQTGANLRDETRSVRDSAEESASRAADAALASEAVANYAGEWFELFGPISIPASTYYQGRFWALLRDVDDVENSEPGVSSAWAPIQLMPDIRRPIPISPKDGDVGVDLSATFSASVYAPLYSASARGYREFQIAEAAYPGWDNLVADAQVDSDSFTPEQLLPLEMQLKWRCRDVSESGETSEWMLTQIFTTSNQFINQPSVISPQDGATDIPEQPILESSPFATTPSGSDSHASTSWRLRNSQGDIVWSSINDTQSLTAIAIPAGVLVPAETYQAEARYEGDVLVDSAWSEPVEFTTADQFLPTVIGQPFGGGFYAGKVQQADGVYLVIVAPKASEASLTWKDERTTTTGTASLNDGLANSNAMNNAAHAAAQYCRAYNGGGLDDWYLPAKDELEACYRNLKPDATANSTSHGANTNSVPAAANYTAGSPAQTTAAAFKAGGAEAFTVPDYYWSSTESSADTAWVQRFSDGYQDNYNKNAARLVRPVRRLKI